MCPLSWLLGPTYATNIRGPPCPVRVQHGACCSGSRVLSALIEGSWLSQYQLQYVSGRRCMISSGWYTTLPQVTATAVGDINRRPSSPDYPTCKGTATVSKPSPVQL